MIDRIKNHHPSHNIILHLFRLIFILDVEYLVLFPRIFIEYSVLSLRFGFISLVVQEFQDFLG